MMLFSAAPPDPMQIAPAAQIEFSTGAPRRPEPESTADGASGALCTDESPTATLGEGDFLNAFEVESVLFDGGSRSRVILGKEKSSGDEQVVKIQCKRKGRFPDRALARTRLDAVSKIPQHKNVVTVHGVMEDDAFLYTVMEPCQGGDLFQLSRKLPRDDVVLMDQKLRRVMTSVLSALEHLHAQGWVHNDVKLENFVLGQPSKFSTPPTKTGRRISAAREKLMQTLAKRGTSSQLLKITDFDFMHPVGDPPGLVLGTDGYIAPEAYEFRPCAKSDLFAAGVLLYVLATGKFPFPDSIFVDTVEQNFAGSRVMQKIHADLQDAHSKVEWGGAWEALPEARAFCQKLMTFEVERRPTAQEALLEAWILGRASELQEEVDEKAWILGRERELQDAA